MIDGSEVKVPRWWRKINAKASGAGQSREPMTANLVAGEGARDRGGGRSTYMRMPYR